MKKKLSKIISVLLVLSFAFAMFPSMNMMVLAGNTNGHTQQDAVSWALEKVNSGWGSPSNTPNYDGTTWIPNDYGEPQCVDLIVAYWDYLLGWHTSGNAADYAYKTLPSGWTYTYTPAPGDIAIWTTDSIGHIAIVTQVYNGSFDYVDTNGNMYNKWTDGNGYVHNNAATLRNTSWAGYANIFIHPNFESSKPVHVHDYSAYVCPDDGAYEPLTEIALNGNDQPYIVYYDGASIFNAPYTQSHSDKWLSANTPLTCIAYVTNKQGQKWFKLGGSYNGKWIQADKVTYHPASDIAMYLGVKDDPMTEGKENALIGNVNSSYYSMRISAELDGKIYCNYSVLKGSLLFQNSDLTRKIYFGDLAPGTHTIKVTATDEGGGNVEKTVNFTVDPAVEKPTIETKTVGGDERTNEAGGKLITLKCATGGAKIHYTLDGTEPTQASTEYTVPFKITDTANLLARAFLEDKKSAIKSEMIKINTTTTPNIIAEDTPQGTRITISGEENSLIYYSVKGITDQYVKYKKPFILTKNNTVSAYARKSGCKDSEFVKQDIEVKVPEKPTFILPATNTKYAQNSIVTFKWNRITNAADYSVNVYLDGELEDTITVTEPNASVCLEKAGAYSIKVTARNVIGSSEESDEITAISMAPLSVIYEDDGSIISEQKVDYGSDASEPIEEPERKGYFFLYWDGNPNNITKDTKISAVYRIRSYDVSFYDQNGNMLGHKQTVEYGASADEPDFSVSDLPEGYMFLGWNIQAEDSDSMCDFTNVDSDMKITAVVGWFDNELPLITEITSATRDDSAYTDDSTGSGNYNVSVRVKNYPDSYTTAILRVSLKTAEGKMVKTESRTIGLKPDEENEFDFMLNYSGTATQVEAVSLGYDGDYKTGSALSEAVSANVRVQSRYIFNDWTEWSETCPTAKDGRVIEEKTLYRAKTKQTKVSTATSLDGWTAESSKWRETGSGTHKYFTRPSGFAGGQYSGYATAGISSYETANTKRSVSGASHNSYIYWRWSFPYCYGQTHNSCVIGDFYGDTYYNYPGTATIWETFESSGFVGYESSKYPGAFIADNGSTYGTTWHMVESYKQTYTDYVKDTTYIKYTDWSDWQDKPIENNSNTQVQTKKVYRYKDKDVPEYDDLTGTEDTTGEIYNFNGNLMVSDDIDLNGKLATVMVYKGKNSDPNESQLQYVGQITLGEDSSYDFSFKTKDEPTISSGDYIVSLGVQGATGLVNVGMITAPKPLYTVNYYSDSTLVDSQQVEEGENAELPDAPQKEGYKFIAWSETGRNVHGDLNISAIYTPITYAVAFVDWVNGNATPFALEYGTDISEIASEMKPEADGYDFLYWDEIEDGNTTVTGNMIISAVYEAKTYTVNFYDGTGEDKKIIATRNVEFGKAAELPDDPTYEDKIFMGWSTDVKWWNVKSDMDVYPILAYNETASNPTSVVGTYIYGMNDTVTLMAADGAEIYYTIDGTEPVPNENAIKYLQPIQVHSESVVIKAIAVEENKNNSEVVDIYFDYNEGNDYEVINDRTVVKQYNPIVKGGDSISLNLKITNNPGLEGYLFFVECDPSVYYMDYVEGQGYDYQSGELTQDGTYFVIPDKNGWKVMWFNTEAAEGDGTLFTLNLKVADGVSTSSYPITVSYSSENMITPTYEEEFDEFDAEFEGTISGATIVGDVNGDNDLTLADVILIAKHKAGISTISELAKLNAADVNRDGNVTLADVVKLARFIIGLESAL